ncbi:UPF0193 protein EVG1 homolog [Anabrus simplex]|uniref:UPF0193 protein EVG1 homolog n=1 Tax=Anabrus simplex TaxID=316456 RepID=UPI0034DD087B
MCSVRTNRVVRGGGLFNMQRPEYSKETQELLKVLMEESKLTILQRKVLQSSIKNGESLPLFPSENVKNLPQSAESNLAGCTITSSFKKRTKEDIIRSGAYEREKFIPPLPIVDKTKEKIKLQSLMAYGKVLPPTPCIRGQRRPQKPMEQVNDSDRFEELVGEVRERIEFLLDMRNLGQEKKYRPIIQQEIAAKVRQMEAIDKERCAQLKDLVEQYKPKMANVEKEESGK